MNNQILSKSIIVSLPDVLLSARPKDVVEDALVKLLKKRLKDLKILWVPSNFRQALANPKLPAWLLQKLESLISLAEAIGWKLSKTLREELDVTIEDIETFNPAYRASLKQASTDIKAGKFVTMEELKKRYGIK